CSIPASFAGKLSHTASASEMVAVFSRQIGPPTRSHTQSCAPSTFRARHENLSSQVPLLNEDVVGFLGHIGDSGEMSRNLSQEDHETRFEPLFATNAAIRRRAKHPPTLHTFLQPYWKGRGPEFNTTSYYFAIPGFWDNPLILLEVAEPRIVRRGK